MPMEPLFTAEPRCTPWHYFLSWNNIISPGIKVVSLFLKFCLVFYLLIANEFHISLTEIKISSQYFQTIIFFFLCNILPESVLSPAPIWSERLVGSHKPPGPSFWRSLLPLTVGPSVSWILCLLFKFSPLFFFFLFFCSLSLSSFLRNGPWEVKFLRRCVLKMSLF